MNQITKIGSTLGSAQTLLLSMVLMATVSACDTAKTASNAPSSTNNNGQVSTENTGKTTQDDAQSETRKKQLESDIRAREQRNNMGGDPQKRTEGDLASEVRSKLEANIPRGKLTVAAKNADITVSGVVTTQEQLDKIKPLAMEIKGVNSVMVKAVVNP
jgi:hyperosmotically inducible periplasmic protein